MINRSSNISSIIMIALATGISSLAQSKPDVLSASPGSVGRNGLQKSVSLAKSLSSCLPVEVQGEWKAGTNLDGKPCNIGGIEYADGIGVDAHSELKYSLDGHYRFFQAWVGLDLSQKGGMVRFQVFTDGQLAFDTGTIRHGREAMNPNMNPHRAIGCRVPVAGIHELKLLVTGEVGTNADWADARLWETAIPLPDPTRFSNPSHLSATPPMGWPSKSRLTFLVGVSGVTCKAGSTSSRTGMEQISSCPPRREPLPSMDTGRQTCGLGAVCAPSGSNGICR